MLRVAGSSGAGMTGSPGPTAIDSRQVCQSCKNRCQVGSVTYDDDIGDKD
jgi:hypothetical protein